MHEVAPGVWEQLATCRFRGFRLSRRMSVVRLRDGGLWLHSPNALDDRLREELAALGPVRYLVAPNTHHHAHLEDYQEAYPAARLFAAPGLIARRPQLAADAPLAPLDALPWGDELETKHVAGAPRLDEFVFWHRASATLITTDLLFHFGPGDTWATRWMARVDGTYGRPALSRSGGWELVADRTAFRASLKAIAAWPVQRLLMVHAREVEALDPAGLRRALAL